MTAPVQPLAVSQFAVQSVLSLSEPLHATTNAAAAAGRAARATRADAWIICIFIVTVPASSTLRSRLTHAPGPEKGRGIVPGRSVPDRVAFSRLRCTPRGGAS